MTKAEQNKLEKAKKYEFIAKTYAVILSSIPVQATGVRKSAQIRLTHKNFNRYIRFHAYGMDINFLIYGDGNVAVELTEALHSKHTEQLFEYSPEIEEQAAFLAKLAEMMPWVIDLYLDQSVMDFHSYMDYVGYSENMTAAYQTMMDEYHALNTSEE